MKNFEEHIKEKANSFELDPLPQSFDKVMDALEKKKKRRFIFWLWFIIPVFAIGSSIGLFRIFSGSTSTTVQNDSHQHLVDSQTSKSNSVTYSASNKENIETKHRTDQTIIKQNNFENTNIDQSTYTDTLSKVITKQNKTSDKYTNETTKGGSDTFIKAEKITQTTANLNEQKVELAENKNQKINESQVHITLSSLEKINFNQKSSSYKIQNVPLVQAGKVYAPEFLIAKRKKFSLGIFSDIGVSKSSFSTKVPFDSTAKGTYTTARSTADKFLFSYTAGLQFRYSPVKFLSIETGIAFTHYESYQIIANSGVSTSSLMDQNEPDSVWSFGYLSGTSVKEYSNIYDYISIPVKVFYQNRWNRIGFEAGGGIIFDIPVNTRSYAADENTGASYLKKDVNGSRLNMFGINVVANTNVVFHIRNFSLFGGPTFKYRLNSMFDSQYIMQQRPFFIGGQVGVRYHF